MAVEGSGKSRGLCISKMRVRSLPAQHRRRLSTGCRSCTAAQIAGARLVANPGLLCDVRDSRGAAAGCGRALSILPHGIVADAKSGVSGAGKAPTAKTHYMYAADNLSAYGVFGHRHTGELLEQIGIGASDIVFTPHLLPIPRGILSTIYVRFKKPQTRAERCEVSIATSSRRVRWCACYETSLPQIQYSVRTNFAISGFSCRAMAGAL